MRLRTISMALMALILNITQTPTTLAYFNSTKAMVAPIVVEVGRWSWEIDIVYPDGTLNLNELIDSGGINHTIPYNNYFIYGGNLFRVTSPTGYNASWHGLPGDSSAGWAFISMTLNWLGEHQRYSNGAIIRVGNRFFQAMHQGNMVNPIINNGPINSGKPWREIQPMEDYMFPFIEGTTLRDYTSPIPEYIIPI